MADRTAVSWPAASPIALGGPPEVDRPGVVFGTGGADAPSIVQRVYSSGLEAWCYYVAASVQPSPDPGSTTPEWTGSIAAHQVLAVR